ncbi:MAG: phospholipase A [Gammaproteobacteria bacterium]|nr:phospholipase A [Gammaproteobacteria bacterium]
MFRFIEKFFLLFIVYLFVPLSASAEVSETGENVEEESVHSNLSSTEAALSVNEPMYFVVGGDGETKGRFQFSFKYRVFDEDSRIVKNTHWLKGFHFAYTQRSLWNLSADSRPFEDSSYRPSFFLDFYSPAENYRPGFIRTGYEHESNGRSGGASRSVDTFFFWPFWASEWGDQELLIAPKFYAYFSRSDNNRDIDDYRGYSDFWLSYGNEDSWLLSTTLRHSSKNHNMIQLDISYPVRKKIFSRTGGYIYMQIFNGYGESLLTYNERQDTQFRIGFAIVR